MHIYFSRSFSALQGLLYFPPASLSKINRAAAGGAASRPTGDGTAGSNGSTASTGHPGNCEQGPRVREDSSPLLPGPHVPAGKDSMEGCGEKGVRVNGDELVLD